MDYTRIQTKREVLGGAGVQFSLGASLYASIRRMVLPPPHAWGWGARVSYLSRTLVAGLPPE